MTFDVDLFVIGGGSGGVRAARTAAEAGARVALAEESRMGGTCVIRGCVPKKLMVFASEFRDHVSLARQYGWAVEAGDFDWSVFRVQLAAELDRLERAYRDALTRRGVTLHDVRARLADPHTVELAGGERITAGTILIATGGHPIRPEIGNANLGLVSDDIFGLEALPKSVLILGGGYIACEFACILNGLGVEVTQYYRGAQILRGFDDEARGLVADLMQAQGIDLHLGTNIVGIEPAAPGTHTGPGPVRIKASNGTLKAFDRVLFATGRAPNTNGLGLEEIGVRLTRRGAVEVDAFSRTAVPSVWAVGDVTDRVQLTPVAIREGMAFTETIFRDNPTPVDHAMIPTAVFTQPELGTVGLSEEAAAAQEPVEVYSNSFRPMRTSFAGRHERVLMKLVVAKATRKILGCHIVAPSAGELIQLVGIAVKAGLTKEDFDITMAVHPTISEELVTMGNPVRSA